MRSAICERGMRCAVRERLRCAMRRSRVFISLRNREKRQAYEIKHVKACERSTETKADRQSASDTRRLYKWERERSGATGGNEDGRGGNEARGWSG